MTVELTKSFSYDWKHLLKNNIFQKAYKHIHNEEIFQRQHYYHDAFVAFLITYASSGRILVRL